MVMRANTALPSVINLMQSRNNKRKSRVLTVATEIYFCIPSINFHLLTGPYLTIVIVSISSLEFFVQ